MKHQITLIPGDGVGPELAAVAQKVLAATGVAIEWDIQTAGEAVFEKEGTPLPERVLDSIRQHKVALKAPITTPVGKGFQSVNVQLRKTFDTFANVRPAKIYPGVRTRFDEIDLVIIRENVEDLYAGIEFPKGSTEVIDFLSQQSGQIIRPDSAISIKLISDFGSRRIAKFAFEYAMKNGRKKITCVHKANIMKESDGLFLAVAREVAAEYPEIEFGDTIVDNMCMQLVQKPELYDTLLCPNLYGDILSDLASGLVGGLGVTPGANIGDEFAIFEAVHGSAPKYAGQNKVNPTAFLLGCVQMLNFLNETSAAKNLEKSIANVIAIGRDVTYDLKENRDDPSAVGTAEMGAAIVAELRKMN